LSGFAPAAVALIYAFLARKGVIRSLLEIFLMEHDGDRIDYSACVDVFLWPVGTVAGNAVIAHSHQNLGGRVTASLSLERVPARRISRSLGLAMGSPVSTMPQNDFRTTWKTNRMNSMLAQEKTFSSLLRDSIGDGIRGALGQAILGVLSDQGLFDKASNPKEFHAKLQSVFGNGAIVIERVIIKDLFRKLNISYTSQGPFDYREALERAREACVVEART
jgi:hypothetical protein